MFTNQRLDAAFREAFPIIFDDTSKFVFFGDVHRGDDSLSDEFGRNRFIYDHALNYYYEGGCTYVEVGDGDELLEQPQFRHIYTAHQTTFELLKKFFKAKKMILLFGNHNLQIRDQRYLEKNYYTVHDEVSETDEDLFPGLVAHEALVLIHKDTEQEIFVVHGHQGDTLNDQFWFFSFFMIRYFWRFMHILGVKYAASPAKNKHRRHKVERSFNRWNAKHDIMMICGHTHRAKFAKYGEAAYFNTGCCIHPRGITCLELTYGDISLVSWRMHSRKDGTLYVKRTVLQGPDPIEIYHKPMTVEDNLIKEKQHKPKLKPKEDTTHDRS
ncbi:MAG: metallophosphoesterase family protein [Eubacteriales bacterium]|nr:metallophosphoesterase family protein [Eubacteriales bacterium]